MSNITKKDTASGLTFAFWLNFCFAIIEVTGGILTNSTAILADALHDGIDTFGIGLAVLLEKFAQKKSNNTFTYGYKRFSLLSSLIISILLLVWVIFMAIQAIQSFFSTKEIHSLGMLWLAILGFFANGLAFLKIKNGNIQEHHHHKHLEHNQNEKAVMLHLLEDTLWRIAVLIGAILIYFTGWNAIDGILTLWLSIYIGYNAILNLITSSRLFLQAIPENIHLEELEKMLTEIEGVKQVHDLHIWSMDGTFHIASLHLVYHNNANPQLIYKSATKLLKKYHIDHPTIQMECEIQEYTTPICMHQVERLEQK